MATPKPLPLLTRPQLATLLSADPLTISRWEHEGLPVAQPGGPGKSTLYDAAVVVAWWHAREIDRLTGAASGGLNPVTQRARKDRAQADLAELTKAERTAELIPRSEFERVLVRVVQSIRTKLLAGPRAWAPLLARLVGQGPSAIEAELRRRIREILTELAGLGRPAKAAGSRGRQA